MKRDFRLLSSEILCLEPPQFRGEDTLPPPWWPVESPTLRWIFVPVFLYSIEAVRRLLNYLPADDDQSSGHNFRGQYGDFLQETVSKTTGMVINTFSEMNSL